jgi:UDP-N-acetylglucosamine 2-epimerase (non-hydrolysing)
MKKISFIIGTRPEAIKLCPLILETRKHPDLNSHVCVTGQHRELLDQTLAVFNIIPDRDLRVMQPNQNLANLTSRLITAIDDYLSNYGPDMVLVQGDTTTTFCAALCAFYRKIPLGHVEAGLRTGNKYSPFPEEISRVLATHLVDLHFAPTITSRDNLLKEGIAPDRIFVTGNTVIDALFIALDKIKDNPPKIAGLQHDLMSGRSEAPLVLITGHRRENIGKGFENICLAITELARKFSNTHFVYPVHLNPNVRAPVECALKSISNEANQNVHLIPPLDYLSFVALMSRATIILTDSGGLQEEAPSLGKPVLVLRDTTERPEALAQGTARLVGTDIKKIIDNVSELLTNRATYEVMANKVNPFGDGQASGRILSVLARYWEVEAKAE